ncbi:biotin--[acetyl-CoA-carboxylase] ligase [Acetivibrio clariflavus]|uniref:Bifunctional ligase/repressor BirA n=1 Tax=Acetivibrio clariflavus (strain DSM 19732 / NBRC 101661 / EBR45) TaxID=720554 RepID=G8LSW2_ACECE|nr:biotin--[acetyl-CoA-carboxylase] ligase [Acetivibrio clariflavus]AEV70475.1 biotin-(acetyl-CoA carboxylase) ligase [Acetivibrio clariflavus DSM 19732]HOP99956.1 biotin--[acetyl-CoA-carboxylase] ligase [Acetivibrio clariflavus]HPU42326.1 biotin--[acetyl-CoA-carboxylase] ligase [Acetivibrio clariflavus]
MKREVLLYLKNNPHEYVSGEQLSTLFGVSRTAIWKVINELKREGYIIESSSKKGYRLSPDSDVLNSFEISEELKTKVLGRNIIYFDQIDSTNNYAKRIALEGCEEGTLIVADCQTSGRGRLGRDWNSANKKGIWMSLVLRPDIPFEEVQMLTLAASVAVVQALYEVAEIKAGIKWPNDIIINGKKVCGILVEMNMEIESINFLVLGIGVNVNQQKEDFSEELSDKATSLKMHLEELGIQKILKRTQLIAAILLKFEAIYDKVKCGDFGYIISEWKKHSVTLGREVSIIYKDRQYRGIAQDITKDGKLIVKCEDGTVKEVFSGEVSVRGLLGYC